MEKESFVPRVAALRERIVAWLLGSFEVLFCMAVTLWLLTSPALFSRYYPPLHISRHTRDAEAIVKWLSTSYRTRSLNLALTSGQLSSKELHHYADVRQVFRWFPRLATGFLIGLLALVTLARPVLPALARAQWRGLLVWSFFWLILGGAAWWDWNWFFARLHHPFFGDTSWRLPDAAYSLQLFPARFWRLAVTAVALGPLTVLGALAGTCTLLQGFSQRRGEPGSRSRKRAESQRQAPGLRFRLPNASSVIAAGINTSRRGPGTEKPSAP
jgi:uncharacterized membrane protein